MANPNIAFLVLAVGLVGICAEFCLPGKVLPGVVGGVLAVLGLAALSTQPTATAGLLLLLLSGLLFLWRYGALPGAVAMVWGAVWLGVGWRTAVGVAAPVVGLTSWLLSVARTARGNKQAG